MPTLIPHVSPRHMFKFQIPDMTTVFLTNTSITHLNYHAAIFTVPSAARQISSFVEQTRTLQVISGSSEVACALPGDTDSDGLRGNWQRRGIAGVTCHRQSLLPTLINYFSKIIFFSTSYRYFVKYSTSPTTID